MRTSGVCAQASQREVLDILQPQPSQASPAPGRAPAAREPRVARAELRDVVKNVDSSFM